MLNRVLLASVIVVLAGLPSSSQTGTGQIQGTVTDASGAVIPGATVALVEKLGAHVIECAFVIELAFLGGAARLAPVPTHSLISYAGEGDD